MTKRKILYGYQIRGGALEIVPEEQRVVQMLFALYSAGASYPDADGKARTLSRRIKKQPAALSCWPGKLYIFSLSS